MKKLICVILALTIPLSILAGCGNKAKVSAYNTKKEVAVLESGIVAENDNLSLKWEQESNNFSLTCKDSGKVWTNYPEDSQADDSEFNTLSIRVQDTRTVKERTLESSKATRIASEKIDNGLKITYYFDSVKIAVPVCYTLRDDSLLISVTGKDILLGDSRYQIIACLPSPMLCRVSNKADNSYLFAPYGLGGIVDNKCNSDEVRKFSATISNMASMETESSVNGGDSTGFRCFGVKDNKNALFCIAESTPGAVGTNITAGDLMKTYSVAFPTFFFADYDYFYGKSVKDSLIKQVSDKYEGTVSMGVYPLSGENADYNGMAKCYRNYLTKAGYIKENKEQKNNSPYSVTYLGGVLTTSSILGIPTKTVKTLTTFEQTVEYTKDLYDKTGILPTVRLSGFGKSGINIGKIAGGYTFSSKLGSDKSRQELEKYISDNKGELYTDFGVLAFNKSGNGFSYGSNYARTAVKHAAEISPVNIPLRDFNKSLKYRLLSRSKISKAVDKLIDLANKKDISGISFNDLGSCVYSDYSDEDKYGVTANMDKDTANNIKNVSKNGNIVAASSATYFAAGLLDSIFEAPVEPSGRYAYETEVPFYQLVFHGVTPMYSSAVNTVASPEYNIMLAASCGTGIGFTLIDKFDTSYMETGSEKLYAMKYSDCTKLITSTVEKYSKMYKNVENSKILRYDILDNDISKTTFENGTVIYANHSSIKQKSPIGEIDGYDFIMNGGETK